MLGVPSSALARRNRLGSYTAYMVPDDEVEDFLHSPDCQTFLYLFFSILIMFDIRKIVVVLLIAILFAVFVFSTIEAVYPSPSYDDFCDDQARPFLGDRDSCENVDVPQEAYDTCEGRIEYRYDSNGCASEYYCETCYEEYDAAREQYYRVLFYVSAVLSLIAIFVALNLPTNKKKTSIHEWVGTGLLLGGAFVLLFGTVQGFNSLDRFVKPIVILAELVLVIYLAYKKLQQVDDQTLIVLNP